MTSFTISLIAATRSERIEGVVSFIGEDASGAFGILAGRHPLVTMLDWGLCRYRIPDRAWSYIALPGGMLSFRDNLLTIATHRYIRDDDMERIGQRLSDEIAREEERRASVSRVLTEVERQLVRRLLASCDEVTL